MAIVKSTNKLTGLRDPLDTLGLIINGSELADKIAGSSFNDTIYGNGGDDAINGTFDNLPEGATLDAGSGLTFRISYTGGDGNDVTLTLLSQTGAVAARYLPVISMTSRGGW